MSWNYRVIAFTNHPETGEQLESTLFAIHEVYYDANGNLNGYIATPADVSWYDHYGDRAGFEIVDMIRTALDQPTLPEAAFKRP